MEENGRQKLGYTTRIALQKLRDDIRSVIEEHKQTNLKG